MDRKLKMASSALFRTLLAGLVAIAGVLGAAVPARAAIFVGQMDPAVGPSAPNLGFSLTFSFYVPDACLALSGFVDNTNACVSGPSDYLKYFDASINLYNTSNPSNILLTVGITSEPITNVLISGGLLAGINTDSNYLNVIGNSITVYNTDASVLYNGPLSFNFSAPDTNPTHATAYVYTCNPYSNYPVGCASSTQSNPATPSFSLVPEPTSVALVITALAAAGWSARRRRAVPGA
jgi:hypothetical protein